MKVGSLLYIGIGLIVAFLLLLGMVAFSDTNAIWNSLNNLYTHPLAVRKAAFQLSFDADEMELAMKSLAFVSGEQSQLSIAKTVATLNDDAIRNIDTISSFYLGPSSDIQSVRNEFIAWKTVRDDTLRLFREGKREGALQRIAPGGAEELYATAVNQKISAIIVFAQGKVDAFFRDIAVQRSMLILTLFFVIFFLIVFTVLIGYALHRGIKSPLFELSGAAEKFQKGELDARCGFSSRNEFGDLSNSFNKLADFAQTELTARERSFVVSGAMLKEDGLVPFCDETLLALMERTEAVSGAVYVADEEGKRFEHLTSIGLGEGGRSGFSVSESDGEFGQAAMTNRITRIRNIGLSSFTAIPTVTGEFVPAEIVTIPVFSGRNPKAMFSLASAGGFSPQAIRLMEDIHIMLSARMNGVLLFNEIRKISEKLETQNRELEAQKKELSAQTDELTEQNIELEIQQRQLEEANRLKTSFLSNMSHELRTPLNSVIALSGVLEKRLHGAIKDEEYGYLEIISRNGRQLLGLINDILDLSRIEAGKEEFDYSEFSIRALVEEIVSTVSPQAIEKGILIENQVSPELPALLSDSEKLRHVVQNIVGNAVKFTERGSVKIGAAKKDGAFSLWISDSGIGIAANQIPFIFDEFRQADESASRKYGGTGLGLAIAKRYAELLGGGITVESAPGKGSTFIVSLPGIPPGFSHDSGHGAVAMNSSPSDGSTVWPQKHGPISTRNVSGEGKSILLVEDSEPAVIQMREILESNGYILTLAANGKKALEILSHMRFDAMILDLMMPEVDGFEVLAKTRNMETSKTLPILILTAKHVTKEELRFLTGNHVYQLIRKGDVNGTALLGIIAEMVKSEFSPLSLTPTLTRKSSTDGKAKILVMEDNSDNLTTVMALIGERYSILSAEDGRSGIELARREKPDLVIMDISLPGMDGFKVFDELKAMDETKQIPVIALTARAMKGDMEEILSYGFDAYVSKPIEGDVLDAKISEVLNGK
jgi:signal transduction histidine kinase/CheY-like chemotaxis protein/HAMP domain-containing protein